MNSQIAKTLINKKAALDNTAAQVQLNPWQHLRHYTDARIALGRAGNSLPTQAHLAFQLDHAKARDAVHLPLDYELLGKQLRQFGLPVITLASCVDNRATYLQRPDLGRTLCTKSIEQLQGFSQLQRHIYDLVIVISEGLSSLAITENIEKMLTELLPSLNQMELSIAPICIVQQGRVAVADDVGVHIQARMTVILIGERPGLSSPDSLGIYFTYHPETGCADSKRNCLSNIRPRGMSYQQAVERLTYLIKEADQRGYSGVTLKDETEVSDRSAVGKNFLLPLLRKEYSAE
ncbi:ethanolamine ammonia-lyase subunit EutC [Psychromonas antarctica]|jgi:ethanolamine ammonia-lyase small subunit|uniref:ethanolamine ammonia-lyase subunit EutC n=1 Tax=Psychromonas antarctica TaxID=67573 RepID=UPI001EE9976C|nr:ethanolamine ammonia-lyase subunit EutC [Psychromonas antarctica]MCG6201124.1 ethanolamine ammonia-lyase subunit EutC [Psychromonas antarctica]